MNYQNVYRLVKQAMVKEALRGKAFGLNELSKLIRKPQFNAQDFLRPFVEGPIEGKGSLQRTLGEKFYDALQKYDKPGRKSQDLARRLRTTLAQMAVGRDPTGISIVPNSYTRAEGRAGSRLIRSLLYNQYLRDKQSHRIGQRLVSPAKDKLDSAIRSVNRARTWASGERLRKARGSLTNTARLLGDRMKQEQRDKMSRVLDDAFNISSREATQLTSLGNINPNVDLVSSQQLAKHKGLFPTLFDKLFGKK